MRATAWMFGAALLAAAGASGSARAQSSVSGVPNALQGFSQNRGKPVQIDAASLEIRDKDRAATFSGNVRVQQGDTELRCKSLVVFYERGGGAVSAMKAATPGPDGAQQIRRLEARGGVVVTQKDQTVTGESGIFDMKANTVTLQGGVVMTQGKNVLRGDKLVVDLTNGAARVESGKSGGGRVQGLFQAGGNTPALDPALSRVPSPAQVPPAAQQPVPQNPGQPLRLN
jgi:lipopolysaccharide export system protein LptA